MSNTDIKAALRIMVAVTETIRESGSVPAGHLYSALLNQMDLETFETMMRRIVGSGLVEKCGQVYVWVGPEIEG